MARKDRSLKRAKRIKESRRITSARGRLAVTTGDVVGCYVNDTWREQGMAMLYLVRRRSESEFSVACFLVDLLCFGLKDAWGCARIAPTEFREQFLDRVPDEINLIRCDVDLIQRLVFGGMAHAHRHGFRLPRNHEKWLRMIGPIPPIDQADTSDFGRDGKLVYVGSVEELHKRLVSGSIQEFVDRSDTDVQLTGLMRHPDQADAELEDDEMSEAEFQEFAFKLAEGVRLWCVSLGRTPSPYLDLLAEEVLYVIGGMELGRDADPNDEMQVTQDLVGLMAFCEDAPPNQRKAMRDALEQIVECMSMNSGGLFSDATVQRVKGADRVNQQDHKAPIILPFRPNS